jgi:hypothetical protein
MKVTSVSKLHCKSVGDIDTEFWPFERSLEVCCSRDIISHHISRVAL